MCIEVFLGSDQPQPITPNDGSWPSIQLRELRDEQEIVRKHFSKPFVYVIGAGNACSCVFRYTPQSTGCSDKGPEFVKLLHDIVEDAAQSGTAEVYCCWWNELQHPPFSCINVKPNHFGGERFGFSCGEILTVVSSSYEEFTGSFTGLKQQITEGDEVYIRGIVHNEAERSLKISFGRDPYTLLADRAIVFKDVWDYLDTPRPYEPPVDEEIGEWDDEEEIVSEESASFDALLGIHENAEDQETAYQINTALRTISFRTANPPVLSLAAEEIIGIV